MGTRARMLPEDALRESSPAQNMPPAALQDQGRQPSTLGAPLHDFKRPPGSPSTGPERAAEQAWGEGERSHILLPSQVQRDRPRGTPEGGATRGGCWALTPRHRRSRSTPSGLRPGASATDTAQPQTLLRAAQCLQHLSPFPLTKQISPTLRE